MTKPPATTSNPYRVVSCRVVAVVVAVALAVAVAVAVAIVERAFQHVIARGMLIASIQPWFLVSCVTRRSGGAEETWTECDPLTTG